MGKCKLNYKAKINDNLDKKYSGYAQSWATKFGTWILGNQRNTNNIFKVYDSYSPLKESILIYKAKTHTSIHRNILWSIR